MLRRILYVLGLLIVGIAAVLAELYFVQGMRIEFTGNMQYKRITWGSERSKHDAAIDASRMQQTMQPLTTPPEAIPAILTTTPAAAKIAPVSYWTDFRGPHRDGVYSESPSRPTGPARDCRRLWRQPIGGGFASFSFGEGRAYTIEQRRDKEAVTAYDPDTGREIWAFTYPASFDEPLGGPGPRATPVYRDGLVYSLGANGDFYCLDAKTGKPKWSKNILADNGTRNIHWAMAGSPLIVGQSGDRDSRRHATDTALSRTTSKPARQCGVR